jgi:hypothetical protein
MRPFDRAEQTGQRHRNPSVPLTVEPNIHQIKDSPMSEISEGDRVTWTWGNGEAEGQVQSVFARKTTRKIKGSQITRNGSADDPALYIRQEDGDGVLKLASEVTRG